MELNLSNPFRDYTIEELDQIEKRFKKIDQDISKYSELLKTNLEQRRAVISIQDEFDRFLSFINSPLEMDLMQNDVDIIRVIEFLETSFADVENRDIVGSHEYLQRHYHSGKDKYDSLPHWHIGAFIIYKSVVQYIDHLHKLLPKGDSAVSENRKLLKKRSKLPDAEKVLLLSYLGVFEKMNGKLNLKEQGSLLSILLDSGKDNLEEMARCIVNHGHAKRDFDVLKKQTKQKLHEALKDHGLTKIIPTEKE